MSSRLKLAGIVLLGSFALAACGGGGGGTADTMPPPPAANPAEERSAIQMALNAAGQALSVVTAAGENATDAQIMDAETKVAQAKAAIAAADDLSDAEIAQHNTALGLIETPLMAARAAFDDAQRLADVGAARAAALQSYMDADGNANKARQAADAAEETAPGSAGAMAAETAAMAARTAADAAKAAHDAIVDTMTKAEADAEKAKAAAAAETAMSRYLTAMRENDTIQTAATAAGEQQRKSDVAAAKRLAGEAVMAAMTAKNDADEAATAAENARDDARAAYEKAMAARTDMATAKEEYEKAKTAAMDARTAAGEANAAYMAAKSAAEGIDDDGTAAAAQTAQMTAEEQQGIAEARQGTAEGHQSTAETAQEAAETARDTHVLGLLMNANPGDDADTMDVNEQTRMAMAVDTAAASATNGATGTTATATWPGDVAATDTAEAMPGALSIAVDPAGSGTPLAFRTAAVEDDPETTGTDESAPQTATMIDGLGDFMHGYSISDGTRHVIVFTDKQQGTSAVAADAGVEPQTLANAAASGGTVTDLGTASGTGFTGVTFYASGVAVGDDTDPDLAFMGSLTCPSGTACTAETNADGTFTITGYVFSGSRVGRAAVAEVTAAENANYLVFGVWLREDSNGDNTADDPDFGAFAVGGSTAPAAAEITGTARYEGSATGVYTAGSNVDYFQGDATLTANFGTPGTDTDPTAADDEAGTITGMIDNIVAGGNAMDDVIYLNDDGTPTDGNISGAGAISGDARMGTATTVDAVTTYTHNGSWTGQFYNGTADDADTADVNESHVAPGSVAGTFSVTGTTGEGDDAVTRSYLGSFGAHKQ